MHLVPNTIGQSKARIVLSQECANYLEVRRGDYFDVGWVAQCFTYCQSWLLLIINKAL